MGSNREGLTDRDGDWKIREGWYGEESELLSVVHPAVFFLPLFQAFHQLLLFQSLFQIVFHLLALLVFFSVVGLKLDRV